MTASRSRARPSPGKTAPTAAAAPSPARVEFSRDERAELAKMVCMLFEHWQLDQVTQCELLGLSSGTRSTLARYRRGEPLADSRDLLDRVGNLLGIHKSLRLLYPHNRELAYRWPSARNQGLDNHAPLEFMLHNGLPGIITVRGYLDFLRGL